MTAPRQQTFQRGPVEGTDYRRFPVRTVRAGARWFRQHRQGNGPWWFAASGTGRFDLPEPLGTCYLAGTPQAAVRELVGPDLAATGRVADSVLARRVVSSLPVRETVKAANVSSARASEHFGVTAELAVMPDYRVPQLWARALHAADFRGIVFRLRCSAGAQWGLAVFGATGPRPSWAGDPQPIPVTELAAGMGLRVLRPPALSNITMSTVPSATP